LKKIVATDGAQMITDGNALNAITERIIGCAYRVGSKLSPGYLEKFYKKALAHELVKVGLHVQMEVPLDVWYDDIVVGNYCADLIVEGSIIIELKAAKGLDPAHIAQCINYLTTTKMPLCLLINFGNRVEIKRIAGATLNTAD
jgi:GxxExxY protein